MRQALVVAAIVAMLWTVPGYAQTAKELCEAEKGHLLGKASCREQHGEAKKILCRSRKDLEAIGSLSAKCRETEVAKVNGGKPFQCQALDERGNVLFEATGRPDTCSAGLRRQIVARGCKDAEDDFAYLYREQIDGKWSTGSKVWVLCLKTSAGKALGRVRSLRGQVDSDFRRQGPLRRAIDDCLRSIELALDYGLTPDDDIPVPDGEALPGTHEVTDKLGHPIHVAPMREGQRYCRALAARAALNELHEKLALDEGMLRKAPALAEKSRAKAGIDRDAKAEAEEMVEHAQACKASVTSAREEGVSDSEPMKLTLVGEITVGQVEAKVCDALAKSGQAVLEIEGEKAREALVSYRTALKGDRLRVFIDEDLIFDHIYGAGGSSLSTPQAVASARAWFIVFTDYDDSGRAHWTVRKYAWRGNAAAGTSEKSGCCGDPPASAYRE